eukprot:CAMPEP_0170490614 /NCGR_PEP_ID=MMETSP0208-20121228/8762_1 /TAXON_ID=197538 /ORGANISM="Strombidium inclinatum, Strain S3" /LENGTH=135 /DNA_ID=CAMNT_0010766055 /DNA_START=511 /DNA_END=918 /DNA_ORIENTATION=-
MLVGSRLGREGGSLPERKPDKKAVLSDNSSSEERKEKMKKSTSKTRGVGDAFAHYFGLDKVEAVEQERRRKALEAKKKQVSNQASPASSRVTAAGRRVSLLAGSPAMKLIRMKETQEAWARQQLEDISSDSDDKT